MTPLIVMFYVLGCVQWVYKNIVSRLRILVSHYIRTLPLPDVCYPPNHLVT